MGQGGKMTQTMPDLYISDKDKKRGDGTEEKDRHRLPGHSHNPLATFSYCPDNVKFDIQEKEEKVILFLRRHLITNVSWIAISALLIFAPLILQWFPLIDFLPARFQFVSLLLWYLVVAAFILENFLSWFFNVYIVTDERLIDVDFYNLIYREVKEIKIDKIQDVKSTMGGVVGVMFGFGDVTIQTAGAVPEFRFEMISNPDRVQAILNELHTQEEQEVLEGRVR